MKNVVRLLAGWLALLVCVPAGQQLPPAFRTGIDAVQLDVSVLDSQRRPVRGLTADDFTVLEDGKPRRIVQFSAIELPPLPPPPLAGADPVPPDIARNDLPDGRLVVILIDPFQQRVMVSGRVSMADPPGLTALRTTARRVLDSVGPGDLTAVAHTIYGVTQNFTTDKRRLQRAIDTSAAGSVKRMEGEQWGSCYCGLCRVEAITHVATALRDEPQRRKTVFFIGERVELSPVAGECDTYLEPATRAMIRATQLANVTVHTVDPNSLETTNVHAGDDFRPGGRPISEAAREQEEKNRAHLIERQQSLQTVADWTGGRAVLNTNAPEQSVRPILEESSAYYLLVFETPDVKPDGRFHPVTVKVNRPDVQVRTRKGYYGDSTLTAASAAAASAAPLETISKALLPDKGLPMSTAAAPFRGTSGTPVVVVTTGVRVPAAPRIPDGRPGAVGSSLEPIEILTSAFRDSEKAVDWQRQRMSIGIPDGGAPGDLRYESVATIPLKPGAYEIRVASRQERVGVVGSVYSYVDVPDFEDDALTLSGLVLFDTHARTVTPPEVMAGVLDTAPTTKRDFTPTDDVAAMVRVYQRRREAAAPVTVTFRVLNGTREVMSSENPLAAETFADSNAADARYALPLGRLQPGSYVLRVDATGHGAATRRELPFTVK